MVTEQSLAPNGATSGLQSLTRLSFAARASADEASSVSARCARQGRRAPPRRASADAGLDQECRLAMVVDLLDVDRHRRVVRCDGHRLPDDAGAASAVNAMFPAVRTASATCGVDDAHRAARVAELDGTPGPRRRAGGRAEAGGRRRPACDREHGAGADADRARPRRRVPADDRPCHAGRRQAHLPPGRFAETTATRRQRGDDHGAILATYAPAEV